MKQDWTRSELQAALRRLRKRVGDSEEYEAILFCERLLSRLYPNAHTVINERGPTDDTQT